MGTLLARLPVDEVQRELVFRHGGAVGHCHLADGGDPVEELARHRILRSCHLLRVEREETFVAVFQPVALVAVGVFLAVFLKATAAVEHRDHLGPLLRGDTRFPGRFVERILEVFLSCLGEHLELMRVSVGDGLLASEGDVGCHLEVVVLDGVPMRARPEGVVPNARQPESLADFEIRGFHRTRAVEGSRRRLAELRHRVLLRWVDRFLCEPLEVGCVGQQVVGVPRGVTHLRVEAHQQFDLVRLLQLFSNLQPVRRAVDRRVPMDEQRI